MGKYDLIFQSVCFCICAIVGLKKEDFASSPELFFLFFAFAVFGFLGWSFLTPSLLEIKMLTEANRSPDMEVGENSNALNSKMKKVLFQSIPYYQSKMLTVNPLTSMNDQHVVNSDSQRKHIILPLTSQITQQNDMNQMTDPKLSRIL